MSLVQKCEQIQDYANNRLTARISDELKKRWEFVLRKLYQGYNLPDELNIKPSWKVTGNPATYHITVNLYLSFETHSRAMLNLTICPYMACCAMTQCNYFGYDHSLLSSEELVHALMDDIMESIRINYNKNMKRLVFNFVEYQNRDKKYLFGEFPPLEETKMDLICYPHMYTWATSKHNQQLLTVNHNTGNIIHFVDCMLDYQG